MNFKSELAQLAAAGINPTALVSGAALVALAILYLARRSIARAVMVVVTALSTMFLFGAISGGAIWLYHRFGLAYSGAFVGVVVLLIFVAGSKAPRVGHAHGVGAGDEDWKRDEEQRRLRAEDLREAQRMQRLNEETIRRNPW